ncbi:hypothetical protein [Stutzerimonas nitrititolerans]|uniref:Uncharacterized protein n=1 Tax=Stutzerimonas nitrititolerans TaxID=2482751 RepID=A0AA41WI33_9GAMM|nr:hypothetical protein [Stutzerimonas nitrititolerans]MCO7543260.1 hypothetical protein [Stutzerimonas nitrititolerans]
MLLRTLFLLLALSPLTATINAGELSKTEPSITPPADVQQETEPESPAKTIPNKQEGKFTETPIHSLTDSKQTSINDISASIEELKRTIEHYENAWISKLTPALFGLLGVLSGGLISVLLHRQRISHELRERNAKYSFEIQQQLYTYRNKQLNEFYGPLLVLLTQSKELSMQLHRQLEKWDNVRYRYEVDKTSPEAKSSLFVYHSETEQDAFRLIEELPHIGVSHKEALPQVKEIIRTGIRMAKLIEEKSGLVDPKNIELSGCLGRYLAHLTALKDAYKQAKSSNSEPQRLHNAVFPREIQNLTRLDYDSLRKKIEAWEQEPSRLGATP